MFRRRRVSVTRVDKSEYIIKDEFTPYPVKPSFISLKNQQFFYAMFTDNDFHEQGYIKFYLRTR